MADPKATLVKVFRGNDLASIQTTVRIEIEGVAPFEVSDSFSPDDFSATTVVAAVVAKAKRLQAAHDRIGTVERTLIDVDLVALAKEREGR